jgi:hypothetical protein
MSAKRPKKEVVPPTLTPAQAIPLLQRQRDRADDVAKARFDDPQDDVWVNSTENILNQAFGKPDGERHANTRAFMLLMVCRCIWARQTGIFSRVTECEPR